MPLKQIILALFFIQSAFRTEFAAQTINVNEKIAQASFDKTNEKKTNKKYFTYKRKIAYFNPLSYIGSGLLFAYQKIISQQIQANCMYHISCSEYTRLAILQRGFIIGTLEGLNQISECMQGAIYEHPPLFISQNKIANHLEK